MGAQRGGTQRGGTQRGGGKHKGRGAQRERGCCERNGERGEDRGELRRQRDKELRWRTLWMVDQVSLTASCWLPSSRNRLLINFLACGPGRKTMMSGYMSNLFFSAFLVINPVFVLAAKTRDGLQEKRETIETSKYVTQTV